MAIRLIEIAIPRAQRQAVEALLSDRMEVLDIRMHPVIGTWSIPIEGVWTKHFSTKQILIRMIVKAEASQDLIDLLLERFSKEEGFRINILSVEASLPEFREKEIPLEGEKIEQSDRISREELYEDLRTAAVATHVYIVMIMLSALVAAFGVLNDNVAVIIGAMVIAPLLGPNVALSLATTLGDLTLAKNALKSLALGTLAAAAISIALGSLIYVDPAVPEIASRTRVGITEMVIALASGCAGVLSYTSAAPGVLIGVAVAVSLLPPLVTFGLLLGAGYQYYALGALMLFLVNIICINLSGVATFLAQGIAPRQWWEAKRARKATAIAISIWISLLAVLILILMLSGNLSTLQFSAGSFPYLHSPV
jgi:uncharacterized hydrophobic protein (TIGR00341 family)